MGTVNVEAENGQVSNLDGSNLMELAFIPNAGQMSDEWAFEVKGQDYNFSFAPDKVQLNTAIEKDWGDGLAEVQVWTVESSLVGAATNPTIAGRDKLDGVANFINFPDPNNPGQTVTRTDVETFGKIAYENVYPGITQIFKGEGDAAGNEGKLTKEFYVAPGADYEQISIQYSGVDNIYTDDEGNLILEKNGWGKVTETAPFLFEDRNNDGEYNTGDVEVRGSYKLLGNFQVGFDVGEYNNEEYTLVIDPVLDYSTYLGGTQEFAIESNDAGEIIRSTPLEAQSGANDQGLAIAVDTAGSAYIAGETLSNLFPGTVVDIEDSGAENFSQKIFVTKLNPEGTEQIFSTYIGNGDVFGGGSIVQDGGNLDRANGIAVDLNGAVYVTGESLSTNLEQVNAVQGEGFGGGSQDGFVFRLNPTGGGLDYSSYLGGPGRDRGLAIAVDESENAYVVGSTNSPELAGEDTGPDGGTDAFIIKIGPDGTDREYFAYIGGLGFDEATGVAVTDDGVAYVTGTTDSRINSSGESLATAGAVQSQIFGRGSDVFVAKVNEDGETDYFTYLGGSLDEVAGGIDVDGEGNAYITGITQSTDFPTTDGVFQEEYQGGEFDAFVSKIVERPESQGGGTRLDYSTFIGGSGDEGSNFALPRPVTGIAVDSTGSAYVVGTTSSLATADSEAPFPITENATQSEFGGGLSDVFVTKLDPSGTEAIYSSYLGGNGNDQGFAIALDRRGAAFVTGQTASTDFTTTAGALQPEDPTGLGASGVDAFVTKIAFEGVSIIEDESGISLTEGGRVDSYSIVLNTQPEEPVTVGISSDAESRTSRSQVEFNRRNWNIPQLVMVGAFDDGEVEGVHETRIIHTAVSPDPSYNNIAIAEVEARITDNDAGIIITGIEEGENLEVAEGGDEATFQVGLKTFPEAPVTITIESDDETTVVPASLVFPSEDGMIEETVRVIAVDDEEREDNPHLSTLTLTVTSEGDENYDGFPIDPITVEVTDDDMAGVEVSRTELRVKENEAPETFDLALTSEPNEPVTITINTDENTRVEPTEVTFSGDNFDEPQEIRVAAVNERESSGDRFGTISFAVVSADPAYNQISIDPITAVVEADGEGVLIETGDGSIEVTEGGGSDSYTVALAGPPIGEVTITIGSGTQTINSPSELTFTPENFDEPQTVIVAAVDDSIGEGRLTDDIVHIVTSEEDPLYNDEVTDISFIIDGASGSDTLEVTINDNDQGQQPATDDIILDVDGNGEIEVGTDGQLILNYVQGLRGTALTGNGEFVGENARRSSANEIKAYLDGDTEIERLLSVESMLDADGNGVPEPNDGRIIRRFIFGRRGNALTANDRLLGDFATRDANAIANHLEEFNRVDPQQSSNRVGAANISSQKGTSGNDGIDGTDGDDLLNGGRGNDTIDGGRGNDTIRGDAGKDVLIGGEGSDIFVLRTGTAASNASRADVVQDFEVGLDKIGLTAGVTSANLEQTFDGSKVTIAIAGSDKVLGVVYGPTGTMDASSFVEIG